MKLQSLIKKSTQDIKEKLGKNLISLYLVGTAVTADKTVGDIDFFAITKNVVDEDKINKWLTKKYRFPIKIRCVLYDELLGKKKKATFIMKIGIFTVPKLAKILESSKLILGKKINFKKLPIKKLNPKDYLKFELKRVKRYLRAMRIGKAPLFLKRDFPKYVAYLVRAEIFLKKKKFIMSYEEMSRQLKREPKHIIHDCVAIRKRKKKLEKDFLEKVGIYTKEMEKLNRKL